MTIQLRHARAVLYPDTYCVVTRFPCGREVAGQRLPTPEHMDLAEELGYQRSDEGLWLSLAEHEIAHSCLYDWLHGLPSATLRHEAGIEPCPLHVRWWEESVVLAFQKWLNTREQDQPLWGMLDRYPEVWRAAFEPYREKIRAAREALVTHC